LLDGATSALQENSRSLAEKRFGMTSKNKNADSRTARFCAKKYQGENDYKAGGVKPPLRKQMRIPAVAGTPQSRKAKAGPSLKNASG
jgi:hypothetical protein